MVVDGMDQSPQVVLRSPVRGTMATAACFEILMSQDARRSSLDRLLPMLSADSLLSELENINGEFAPLVAYVDDVPYACAFAGVEEYGPDDDGLAYFPRLTGVARGLGVRDGSASARAALTSLAKGLIGFWHQRGASGAKILWPVSDFDIADDLSETGFAPDAYIEYRPQSNPPRHRYHDNLHLRVARREDLAEAVQINSMILDEHVKVSPFARHVPGVDERFTARFLDATAEKPSRDVIVLVAEYRGRTVGMTECEIEQHDVKLDATFPAGTLGYIHAFGVERHLRRRGVGTALASFALEQLHLRGATGIRLLVSHYNHVSGAFWTQIGFKHVWRLFQRRRQ